jgi:hypothetical protein
MGEENPSESRGTRLRAPLAEKTEGREGLVGTIESRDGRSLEVRRYCEPRLRPWALIATGPLRGPRFTPCRRPLLCDCPPHQPRVACCLRGRQRIWRVAPPTRPTTGSPCARPGGLRLQIRRSKQYNQQNWGLGSHLTGFVGLTPSPCRSPNRQSARLRPALVELHGQ